MKGALILVIVGGLVIGFSTPFGHVSQAPPEPPKAGKPSARKAASPASPPAGQWGGETRLSRRPNGHFYASAQVNGQPTELVVDTGASTVALTVEDARRAGIMVDPSRFAVIGTGASGPVRGHEISIARIAVNGREVRNLGGVVLEGLEVSLLGQTYLSHLDEVRMTGEEMVLR